MQQEEGISRDGALLGGDGGSDGSCTDLIFPSLPLEINLYAQSSFSKIVLRPKEAGVWEKYFFFFPMQRRGAEPFILVKSIAALTSGSSQPCSVPLSQALHLGLSHCCY